MPATDDLKDLCGYSTGHWQKLMAAWEDLNTETQIEILSKIDTSEGVDDSKYELYKDALKSQNSYIRYLAAKWVVPYIHGSAFVAKYVVEDGKLIKSINGDKEFERDTTLKLIRNDSCDLVKYSEYEMEGLSDGTFYEFWNLPRGARLACMRSASFEIWLLYQVKSAINLIGNNELTWEEVGETLEEFACHNFVGATWRVMDSDYEPDTRLYDLWKIIPLLRDYCAKKYLEYIPYHEHACIDFKEIISKCTDWQLEVLLNREDVKLKDIRKEVLFDIARSDKVKKYAVRFHFYPTYEEFGKILKKSRRRKEDSSWKWIRMNLDLIGSFSTSLNLCMYEAIDNIRDNDYLFLKEIRKNQINRLQLMNATQQAKEILDLRLYMLADKVYKKSDYPQGYPYDDCVSFLRDYVVDGNRWKTFMAFSVIWPKEGNKQECKDWLKENTYLNDEIEKYEEKTSEIDEIKNKLSKLEAIIIASNNEESLNLSILFSAVLMRLEGISLVWIAVIIFSFYQIGKYKTQKKWLEKKIRKIPKTLKITAALVSSIFCILWYLFYCILWYLFNIIFSLLCKT